MQITTHDRALIVNALHDKAARDARDARAAKDCGDARLCVTLETQAERATELADAIEAGEPMRFIG